MPVSNDMWSSTMWTEKAFQLIGSDLTKVRAMFWGKVYWQLGKFTLILPIIPLFQILFLHLDYFYISCPNPALLFLIYYFLCYIYLYKQDAVGQFLTALQIAYTRDTIVKGGSIIVEWDQVVAKVFSNESAVPHLWDNDATYWLKWTAWEGVSRRASVVCRRGWYVFW